MTENERGALASLLSLRTRAREQAERDLVSAQRALDAARHAIVAAREELEAHRTASNAHLDEARSTARTGADYVAVDALGRSIREQTKRLVERLTSSEAHAQALTRDAETARGGLARAEADEKAVGNRIAAAEARDRTLALGRADDEADERAGAQTARKRR